MTLTSDCTHHAPEMPCLSQGSCQALAGAMAQLTTASVDYRQIWKLAETAASK